MIELTDEQRLEIEDKLAEIKSQARQAWRGIVAKVDEVRALMDLYARPPDSKEMEKDK